MLPSYGLRLGKVNRSSKISLNTSRAYLNIDIFIYTGHSTLASEYGLTQTDESVRMYVGPVATKDLTRFNLEYNARERCSLTLFYSVIVLLIPMMKYIAHKMS